MDLKLTIHAIDRFQDHWRSSALWVDAQAELEVLIKIAAPSRRKRVLTGNARLYIVTTPTGEQIGLAVRENTVITVLPPEQGSWGTMDVTPDAEMIADSQDNVAACRAMLDLDPAPVAEDPEAKTKRLVEEGRIKAAETLILQWKRGRHFTMKAVHRAYGVLKHTPPRNRKEAIKSNGPHL